jgi:Protein of unknown function (DUF3037)
MHSSTKPKMPEKHVFEYAVIRIVPKVERGEFLNAGVIVFCKRKKYLQMRFQVDAPRLQAFAPAIDVEEIAQYLVAWDVICTGAPAAGEFAQRDVAERFRWLTAAKSTIIQCSKVHPGLCEDPAAVLEDLFGKYVG